MAGTAGSIGTPGPAAADPVAAAGEALQLARRAAEAYRRPDLIRRLEIAARRVEDAAVRVLVVGEYKQGKSSLVDALLGADICPVDDHLTTGVPTAISFGESPGARIIRVGVDGGSPTAEEIPLERLPEEIFEASGAEDGGRPARPDHVDVFVPNPILEGGLALVDTPGVGGLRSMHTASTIAALPWATAVLFVSDASQEYTATELEFLRAARSLCPNVLCVLTKIDLHPEWRRILDLDREHLREADLPLSVLPVSSTLRRHHLATGDGLQDEESGFRALVAGLMEVKGNGRLMAARAAAADALFVVSQLEGGLRGEREVLTDPALAARVAEGLAGTRERAERLRGATSRWSIALGDGVADLSADLDHDLRVRIRTMTRESDQAIEESDPTKAWDAFGAWVTERAAAEVTQNYTLLAERAAALAERVADLFEGEEMSVRHSRPITPPSDRLQDLRPTAVTSPSQTVGQRGLMALRGVYSGTSMFGSLSGLAGLAFLHPAAMALGLLMGRSAIRDQHQRELTARRAQAKTSVRQYLEDVTLGVSKDSKDTLRAVQRELRDGFAARAEELSRSAADALAAAQRAAQAGEAQRQQRLAALEKDLQYLSRARAVAGVSAPDLAAAVGSGP